MKSFSQFLQESYLSEEIPGNISRDEFNKLPARSKRNLTGGSDVGLGLQDQPLQKPKFPNYGGSSRPAVRSARTRSNASPESWEHRNPGKLPIPNPPSGTSSNPTAAPSTPSSSTPPSSTPQRRPPAANTTPQRRPPSVNPSSRVEVLGKPPSGSPPKSPGGALALRPQGSSALTAPAGSPSNPIRTNLNVPGGARPKIPGLKSGGAISAALGTADEKMSGSGWLRSLAKGATVGTGAVLGGLAGGAAGTAIAPGAGTAIGGYAGQAVGAAAAEKAFDTVAGANAVTRKAMATANRQRQAGGGIKGIGGPTSFSQKKPGGPAFMSTGVGNQRKTVQLAKTSVVRGPGGKEEVGHLAIKDGEAVYKRAADPKTLAKTSSNPFEIIGRSFFAGAYKEHDRKMAQQALQRARQNDINRNKKLGVKYKPGG